VLSKKRVGEVGSAHIGSLLSRSPDAVPVNLDVRDFTSTHLAIIASTGAGKSYLASVVIEELSEAASLVADTGSGSVRVQGDLSALTELLIDTGSGSVTLEADAWPSMEIVIDTGSGGVGVDVPGALLTQDADRRSIVRIGEAKARGIIDTGSGSVRLRTRTAPATD